MVNGVAFRVSTFFLLVGRSFGAFPSCKTFAISSRSFGATSIQNRCASRRSSSMHVESSLVSSQNKWSGRMFIFPGQLIMSNSNSWNNSSHRQIFPWWTGLLTKYFNPWWFVKNVTELASNVENFVVQISLTKLPFPWSNSLFLLCSIPDWCTHLADRLHHRMVVLEPIRQQRLRHRHGHETFSTSQEILI